VLCFIFSLRIHPQAILFNHELTRIFTNFVLVAKLISTFRQLSGPIEYHSNPPESLRVNPQAKKTKGR